MRNNNLLPKIKEKSNLLRIKNDNNNNNSDGGNGNNNTHNIQNNKILFLFATILILTLISITSTNTHAQDVDIKLILPDNVTESNTTILTEKDDLLFYVCPNTDVTNIKASMVCKENFKFIDLDTIPWSNNCYLTKYDLEDINCQNLQIMFEYKEENQQIKLTKNIAIGKNSNILGYILTKQNANGGFDQNPLYTAYGIWVMANYGDIYSDEMSAAISWLKYNRDEEFKCWPKNSCDITTTSTILLLLKEAGFNDELRIVNDAKIWIEKNQNYLSNSKWTLRLDANEVYVKNDATCNITYEGIKVQINISVNTIKEYNITVNNNKDIKVDCSDEVQTTIFDQFNSVVYSKDQKNLQYHIGDACWGTQQFQTCKEYSNDNFVKYAINVDAAQEFMYNDLNLTITNDTRVSCSIRYGGQLATFSLPQNKSYEYSLLVNQEDDVIVNCDYNTKITIYNEDYIVSISNTTKNITYTIRNNCDITNKHTVCDVKATSASIAAGTNPELSELAYNWMLNNTIEDVVGEYIISKDILSNELFLLATTEDYYEEASPIMDWLTYNQNNDGSWGHSTKIRENLIETIYGALALAKFDTASSKEGIKDAKEWTKDYEPESGWGDVEKDSLAFWAIKDQIRPFLKSTPGIININQDEVQVNIVNPTDFNIKDISFEFTDGLDNFVSVEPVSEIFKKSYKRIVLKLKNKKEETHYGFIIIKNRNYQLAKIPVITSKLPDLGFTLPQNTIIYGDKTKVRASIPYKTNGTFACTLKWDTTLVDKVFTITNENNIEVTIETKEVKRQTRNVTGELICTKDQNSIRNSVSINIDQYVTKPFDVKPKSLIILETKKDISFEIENLIDKAITVSIDFDKDDGLLEINKRKITINPYEKENITIINLIPDELNFTQDYELIISSLGQEEIIPLRVAIIEIADTKTSFTNLYIILILLFIFTISWGYLKVNKLVKSKKQQDILKNIVNSLRKNKIYISVFAPFLESFLESKYPIKIAADSSTNDKVTIDSDMIVAVKFMKTIGKDEKTITEKLKAQGFNDAYIKELLKQTI